MKDDLTYIEEDRGPKFPFQVGNKVRNRLTGKTYRVREVLKTVAIVQSGSTAIKVRLENLEPAD